MKIRPSYSDKAVYDIPDGSIELLADDGNVLYRLTLDGTELEIHAGHWCRHAGKRWSDLFSIVPVVANIIRLRKQQGRNDKR